MECFQKVTVDKKRKKIPEDIFNLMDGEYNLKRWWNYHHMIYEKDNNEYEIYFKIINYCTNFELYDETCKECRYNIQIIEWMEITIKSQDQEYIKLITDDKKQMNMIYNKFRHKNQFFDFYIE